MDKAELQKTLKISVLNVEKWYSEYPDNNFEKVFTEGKWTAGQHLLHLVKTAKAINGAFKIPKLGLRLKFGTRKHEELSYDVLTNKYLTKSKSMKFVAPEGFEPGVVKLKDKDLVLEKLNREIDILNKHIEGWSEKALSKYVVPHPIFGKMTFREMLMFISFHHDHHLRILNRDYIL